MVRPKASNRNKFAAMEFVRVLTKVEPCLQLGDSVAINAQFGRKSLHSALIHCIPHLTRSDECCTNRKGISEMELNKMLKNQGHTMSRKSDFLFDGEKFRREWKNLRWIDPFNTDCESDAAHLKSGLKSLHDHFPESLSCTIEVVLTFLSKTRCHPHHDSRARSVIVPHSLATVPHSTSGVPLSFAALCDAAAAVKHDPSTAVARPLPPIRSAASSLPPLSAAGQNCQSCQSWAAYLPQAAGPGFLAVHPDAAATAAFLHSPQLTNVAAAAAACSFAGSWPLPPGGDAAATAAAVTQATRLLHAAATELAAWEGLLPPGLLAAAAASSWSLTRPCPSTAAAPNTHPLTDAAAVSTWFPASAFTRVSSAPPPGPPSGPLPLPYEWNQADPVGGDCGAAAAKWPDLGEAPA